MPAGRPTEYTKTMGDEILSLMAEGLSLAAAEIDIRSAQINMMKDGLSLDKANSILIRGGINPSNL